MGFWQGLNEATIRIGERKDQERAIKEERELAKKEKAEDREYDRQLRREQIVESRTDSLIALGIKYKADRGVSKEVVGKAKAFFSRLGDVDDPRVAALSDNPVLAAGLEDRISAIEIERNKAGLSTIPLAGEALLDLTTVYNSDTGDINSVDVELSDFLTGGDLLDNAAYGEMYEKLLRAPEQPYATLKPEAYYVPTPKVLEEGRLAFDEKVMELAQAELATGDKKSPEYTELFKLVEEYKTAGSPGRTILRKKFGPSAYETLEAIDSPFIQSLNLDPQLSEYNPKNISLSTLQAILSDPNAPPDQKAWAQGLIDMIEDD